MSKELIVFVFPIVLFDRASVPARVASVPVVGRVTFVVPVVVRVRELAPEVIRAPASVKVWPWTEVKLANVSIALSIVLSVVPSIASSPLIVPVPVRVNVSVLTDAKVTPLDVVKFCPVLKASCVSPIESFVILKVIAAFSVPELFTVIKLLPASAIVAT